jgi:hypothetical protein
MPDEPVVTPPAPPAIQAGPWEQDIRAAFTDPQEAARVDAFLRSRVQPRVTQLEQQVAETREAQNLWDAFHQDPESTFRAIQAQLVDAGYSVGEANAAAGEALAAAQGPAPAAVAAAQTEDPRLAEMYADWTQQRELAAYDAQMAEIANDPANRDVDPNRLHLYVSAADGDFDRAIELYRADTAQVLTRYGIDPATATQQQQEAAAAVASEAAANGAPPVMGAGAGGAGAPLPTQPDYRGKDGLHKAIEDAAAESFRTSQAPPAVS